MSLPIHALHSVNRLSSYKSKTNEAESARVESTHKDVPLVEFMYLVFTCMPGESYCRRVGSLLLLCLCYVFKALLNSLVC